LTASKPDAPGTDVVRMDGVQRSFGEQRALDDFSLRVGAGEVVGLLGHNGAGKTTTVRVLTGILAPDAGNVRVHGLDPLVDGPVVRRATGVVSAALSVRLRPKAGGAGPLRAEERPKTAGPPEPAELCTGAGTSYVL
jgi:ABC-type molybdenum transport system ATPase subunit/photorepair protein PhrA